MILDGKTKMKIQGHLDPTTRKNLRNSLKSSPTLHKFAITLQRKYCTLTGFMHVLPDFYILGVEKGGTSSLYNYLVQHPFIHSAVTKEINFINKYYDRGTNWYRVCFPFNFQKFIDKHFLRKNFITGEASVRYFDYPHSPERIKKLTPNAKFILLLRNPIDRAYSEYSMTARWGVEKLSFEEAINIEKERTTKEYEKMINDQNYYHENYFRHAYLKRGIYIDLLKRWLEYFPREQFYIAKSEDFFENPSVIYNKILKFLDLSMWELEEYEIIRLISKKSKIDMKLRKKLVEFFKPHNERLYQYLGINFHWDE